eukprot:symbB.v1.2.005208.t1/scaffold266.1/size251003/5
MRSKAPSTPNSEPRFEGRPSPSNPQEPSVSRQTVYRDCAAGCEAGVATRWLEIPCFPMSDQKQKITAAFNDSTVGMHEPVSPIMLALVLRQIMPSLNIAQVDEMATAHMLEKDKSKETTFSDFLEQGPIRRKPLQLQPRRLLPAVPMTMPEEAAKSWSTFQELLKTRPYLADPSTGHPLCSFVEQCNQSFSEKKFEETAILVERITSTITEDEKRITAAFKHFDKDGSGVRYFWTPKTFPTETPPTSQEV